MFQCYSGFELYNGIVYGVSAEGSGLSVLRYIIADKHKEFNHVYHKSHLKKWEYFCETSPFLFSGRSVCWGSWSSCASFQTFVDNWLWCCARWTTLPSSSVFSCSSSSSSPSLAWTSLGASSATQKPRSVTGKTLTLCSGPQSRFSRWQETRRPAHHLSALQVLTQEDWNIVLFAGMERTSHWAALYFVALMTFGNYVLFNLLVAILVEGFSNQVSLRTSHCCSDVTTAFVRDKIPPWRILPFNQVLI